MWMRIWGLAEDWLYSGVSHGDGAFARLVRFLRYPFAVLRDLLAGQLNLRAMVLVYATLLSLIPALALSFAVLKGFGVHRELEPLVLEFFKPLGAGTAADLTARVMAFAENVRAGLVGAVGFALLLGTLLGTAKNVEDSFNFVWRVQVPRSFARRIAEYAGLLIVGPVLLVAVIGLSKLALDSEAVHTLAVVPLFARVVQSGIALAPYAIVCVVFTLLYVLVPNTRVQLLPAAIGAVCAGILWAATGMVFTHLVVTTSRLTIVYAGFALVVATLVWTYLGWLILLAGAQLSFYIQNPSYLRQGMAPLSLSGKDTERVALNVMYLVGRAHARGNPRWSVDALARELALPGLLVARIVDTLEIAKLLIESKDEQLFPGRDLRDIALADILDAVRLYGSGHPLTRSRSSPAVERILAELDGAWRERCGTRSLKELVEQPDALLT